jgi:hypothetical protein
LRDLEPELAQFAVDARRTPKRVLNAHTPDQCAEVRLDLGQPSPGARLPTPVAAKARPMPTNERLGPYDCEDPQDRRKPAIQLDKEPAVVVRKLDPALHLTPQNDQLMSKHCILSFKPALRLEWRNQDGQGEAEKCEHRPLTLGDSVS